MSGTVNATSNIQMRSGNRIRILLGGIQVGTLQSVSMSDDYSPEPASGIGDIHVQEYVPTMARHTVSVSTMVMKRADLYSAGAASENGDVALLGLVFDIECFDKDNFTLLRAYRGCYYASGSLEVSKHSIVMASGTFMALNVDGDLGGQ